MTPEEDNQEAVLPQDAIFDAVQVLESIEDACYVLDHDWRFVFLNSHAERLLLRTRGELLGRSVWEEFPEAVGSGFDRQYRRAVADRVAVTVEEFYPPLNTWFEVRAFPYNGGVAVFFQDIDHRKRAERAAQAHRTAILESITDAFFALDAQWRFTYLNAEAERVLGRSRDELLGNNVWDEFPAAIGTAFGLQYHRAVGERTAVTFEEYYPPLDAWFEVRAYPSEDGLSVFFQNINARRKTEEALLRSQADLRLAVDAARLGTFYCDWPLDKIVWNDTCKEHFFLPLEAEVDFALFYSLLHPDDREPTRQAIEQAIAERREYNVEYRTQAPDGRTRWINAVGRFYYRGDGTPIRFDGITIDISSRKAAEEEALRRTEREAMLARIGLALRASPDPEQLLWTVVREVGQVLGVDRCYFATYDEAADTTTVGPEWHRADLPSMAGMYQMSSFLMNQDPDFRAGHTQVLADTTGDVEAQALGLRALVRVPLLWGTARTGLSVIVADEPRAWTPEEISLLEAVAIQTQTALEAARISRKEHEIAQQLQDALQPAVPEHVPGLSMGRFTRPALDEASVGGDFYDIFPLDKDLFAIVIGDVSGKGLAAAQQLALIRNSLRTTLYLSHDPAHAASTLNTIVTAHDLLIGFVTAWVGVYDAATGQINYCSCGHEPGIVRKANDSLELLETTGPPLGVAESAEYTERLFTLTPGNVLVLYTDGLSESGPNRRDLLGTDGLMRLLAEINANASAQEQTNALVSKVSAYADSVFRDDVAVLLVRRE